MDSNNENLENNENASNNFQNNTSSNQLNLDKKSNQSLNDESNSLNNLNNLNNFNNYSTSNNINNSNNSNSNLNLNINLQNNKDNTSNINNTSSNMNINNNINLNISNSGKENSNISHNQNNSEYQINNDYDLDQKYENYKDLKNNIDIEVETSNYEKAIILCKKLLFFLPNDADTYLLLNRLYLKIYDISSSITCIKKALLLTKSLPEIKFQLNNLLFCKGILTLQTSKKIEYDIDFLTKIKKNMTKADYFYLQAKAYLGMRNIKECINSLNKILSFDKDNENALVLLAKVLMSTGKIKEGENIFWRASKVNPGNEEVQQFVKIMKDKTDEVLKEANVFVLKGRLKMGILLCSKALRIYPRYPEALILRSSIYKSIGFYNESVQDLLLAKKYASEFPNESSFISYIDDILTNIYNDLSKQKIDEKNVNEAFYYIDECISNNPNNIQAHKNKGDCYLLQKDIINAKEEYLKCYELNPDFLGVRTRLAQVFYKLAILSYNGKDYEEALDYLNKSIEFCDRYDYIFILRSRTYLKLNLVKYAYDDATVAYYLNPKNQDAIEIRKFLSQ